MTEYPGPGYPKPVAVQGISHRDYFSYLLCLDHGYAITDCPHLPGPKEQISNQQKVEPLKSIFHVCSACAQQVTVIHPNSMCTCYSKFL